MAAMASPVPTAAARPACLRRCARRGSAPTAGGGARRAVFRRGLGVTVLAAAGAAGGGDGGVVKMGAQKLTPEGFAPFGQVVGPIDDMIGYEDTNSADLDLSRGTPRFYIMTLPRKGNEFDRITYHNEVTQCLGSLGGHEWYMAVAKASGGLHERPAPEDITCFRIPSGLFVKMEKGTWHAGPYFTGPDKVDFFNLELADTNVVDHNTHDYSTEGLKFVIEDDAGLV